jgi:hypothetical protein
MSLNSIIRNAVAVANKVTTTLQGEVQHAAWIRQDPMGTAVYGRRFAGVDIYGGPTADGVATTRKAVIELKQRIREIQGRQIVTFAHLTFVGPIAANAVTTFRKEPVDPRDVIILPDGTTGPIVDTAGVWDAEAGQWFAVEVWLGDTLRLGGGR